MTPDIPERVFYRIRDVCNLTGLKPHILRYWENEFKDIRSSKNSKGQRLCRKRDLRLRTSSTTKGLPLTEHKRIPEHSETAYRGDQRRSD